MTAEDELDERRTARLRAVARSRSDGTVAARPAVEPGGEIYFANLAAHGGKAYCGGPVCWDSRVTCEGICRDCPREAAS